MSGELAIFNRTDLGDTYSSFQSDSMEDKIRLYNAINNPETALTDCVNMTVCIKDIVVMRVRFADTFNETAQAADSDIPFEDVQSENRGVEGFRVIILDKDGHSYKATSTGIYNSIATMFNVFGSLHFEEGLNVEVKRIQTKRGQTYSLKIV